MEKNGKARQKMWVKKDESNESLRRSLASSSGVIGDPFQELTLVRQCGIPPTSQRFE
jgi:hypothetical protein